jgi:hypothetical protein
MAISNGYATLDQVKAALRITDSVDNDLLELAIEAASRAIDGNTGRNFYSAGTAVRYFAADDDLILGIDDLAGTAITLQTANNADGIYDVTWDTNDYQLEPLNGNSDGIPFPYKRIRAIGDYFWPIEGGEALIKITGVWGWPSVPTAIKQACVIQSSRIYKRLDSPLGVAGFGDLGVMRVTRDLDPDVAQLIGTYRKVRNIG